MNVVGKISEIQIYPIKSFAGIQVTRALTHKYGLAHADNPNVIDRKWMVVDEKGSFLTQRQLPKMALIQPRLESANSDYLVLSAPGKQDIQVPIKPAKTSRLDCRVWNLRIEGYAYGGNIAKWINEFLERDNLDLVVFGDDMKPRHVIDINEQSNEANENDYTIYVDYSPYMIISQASLDDLNKRFVEKNEKQLSMRSFRPNFIASNCEPYAEDSWKRFRIGESTFYKIKDCVRCFLTTVDPNTGTRNANQEPLKTLKEYRSNKEMYGVSPMFGMHFSPESEGGALISVGDEIIELEATNSHNI